MLAFGRTLIYVVEIEIEIEVVPPNCTPARGKSDMADCLVFMHCYIAVTKT